MSDKQKKILIIDDDARNIFALRAVLKSKGYCVESALTALDGIAYLSEHSTEVGIVLLDMMMPEMDGYEAIAEIRKDIALNHIPIIAVTAQAMTGDREKTIDAGADGYVSKPVDVDLLKQYLDTYIK
jgi:two-component system cell cycle response regulator DivK